MSEELKTRVLRKVRDIFGEAAYADYEPALAAFIEDVRAVGGKAHLVGRENLESNIEAQIVDSALMLKAFERTGEERRTVADIGPGAGFPGIIWKVLKPELEITLIERKSKMAAFLSREAARLKLKDLYIYAGDAAEAEFKPFQAVVSKAAGKLTEILPVAEKLLESGGIYITIKGPDWEMDGEPHRVREMRMEKEELIGRGKIIIFRKF
ncbi:MAG: 16S rRNA (guanine(527)-N(7))-methyltransferase RsmG [Candidatus Krumholzibacteriales bacterium]